MFSCKPFLLLFPLLNLAVFYSTIVGQRRGLLAVQHRLLVQDFRTAVSDEVSSKLNESLLQSVGEKQVGYDDWTTIPIFFHIPKAGGSSMLALTGFCLDLVVACHIGATNTNSTTSGSIETDQQVYKEEKDAIGLMSLPNNPDHFFVNVDTTEVSGLVRARDLGFAQSKLAQVIFTGLLPQATNTLLDDRHKGSVFALFRDPVQRVASLFYYLQDATWEPTYHPEWKEKTLMDYIEAGKVENNWMVRTLTGNIGGPISEDDLTFCKEFVTNKVWVGLLTEMGESLRRFGALYSWDRQQKWGQCLGNSLHHKSNSHNHPKLEHESEEYKHLAEILRYDLELYHHAVETFHEQRQFFN